MEPYHVRVESAFEEGAPLDVHVVRPDGKETDIPPHIMRIEPGREITRGGGIKGIFRGDHVFLLEPLAGERTRLHHNEHFSGIAVGFADLPEAVISEGYRRMNTALKMCVESGGAMHDVTARRVNSAADCRVVVAPGCV